jgi:hypothetical protein
LQLVIALILTFLTALYSLKLLTDALSTEGSIKVMVLTLGSAVLTGIDVYVACCILKILKRSKDELEDS